MTMNYENDIRIDESALDVEWLDQPSLMMKYGRYAAEMRMEADAAKEYVDFIKAELDRKIREDPEKFDIGKITETVVMNTILTQEEYMEANKKYLKARYEAEVAKVAVTAIEQRKAALENLVKLHGQQYFAGPSVPRNLNKEWERKERQKKADIEVARAFKRRK